MGNLPSAIGVYEITSPSGRVYVGQSRYLEKRFNKYKNLNCINQPKLYNSLLKYGFYNHRIKVIEFFYDENVSQETLDRIEICNIQYNKDIGKDVLNIASGGSRGKHSKETIEKLKQRTGKLHHSYGKKRSKEFIEKMTGENNPNFGNRGNKNPNFGKKQSKERILKTSGKNHYMYGKTGNLCHFYGKKQSPDHIFKRSGKNHPSSKEVIITSTGEVCDSITEAANKLNIPQSSLASSLRENKTNSKYYGLVKYVVNNDSKI